jgi:Glycosyltransferase family 10 (fucosyltransferase) C-term/Fucosyltransferase, N-terminal
MRGPAPDSPRVSVWCPDVTRPLILFWSDPYFSVDDDARRVADHCELTTDRARFELADAVVFPVPTSGLDGNAPPPERARPDQCWVAWSWESSVHFPQLDDPSYVACFDLMATYRLDSHVPIPHLWDGMFDALAPIVPAAERTTVPVAAFVSSPWDRCGRNDYLAELMQHVEIDSFGRVCHNRDVVDDHGRETKLETIARYPFTIAFENSVAHDYVTEKFFEPLLAGSVPIYRGAPNVAGFAPGERCYLDASAFAGPRELAAFITGITDADYDRYHEWRAQPLRREFTARCRQVSEHPLVRLARYVPVIQFGRRAAARRRQSVD